MHCVTAISIASLATAFDRSQVVQVIGAKNIEPDCLTLLSYAAEPAWVQVVEKTGEYTPLGN